MAVSLRQGSSLLSRSPAACSSPLLLLLCLLSLTLALTTHIHAQDAAKPKIDLRAVRSEAETAAAKGDSATAIKLYSQIISADPSQILYFHRASAYLKRHQHAHALSDLNRALELDPKFTKGLMFRAKVHKVTGDCQAALKDVQALLEAQPTHKEALSEMPKVQQCLSLVQQADSAMAQHAWDHAKHVLTLALDVAYESQSLLLKRVQCHVALNDWQSVLVDTRKVLQSDKSNTEALLVRGRAYYALGETDNALTHWKEGLRQDPEHRGLKDATKALRLLLRRIANADAVLKSNPTEALEELDLALSMPTETQVLRPGMLLKKSEALINLKRFADAVQAANEAIAIDEANVEAYIKRAEAKLGLEEYEQAIADYTKATQLNPQHQGAQQGLHHAQVELKKSLQKDYYKELGIERTANARQIKKAYLKMALLWHPDKHESDADKTVAEKKFQAVAEAYEVLSDPETKGKYDRGEEYKPNQGGQQQQHHNPFGFHFQQGGHHHHQQQQQYTFRWG